jgi:hypothetical protein
MKLRRRNPVVQGFEDRHRKKSKARADQDKNKQVKVENEEDCMDYHFVFARGGAIPPGAQPNGNEANGEPLWVARSPGRTDRFFFHGGIHPGKVRPGFGAAFIPFGGNEEAVPDYEVLMEAGIWIAGSGGQIPDGAVVCGRSADGDPLFVARANLNGGLHPGKIRFNLGAAFIGWGGKEVHVNDYEVLTSPVIRS